MTQVAVCSQINTKHINTQCGQNVQLLNVKPFTDEAQTALDSLTLEEWTKIFPKYYQYTQGNTPEEGRSHLLSCGNLKIVHLCVKNFQIP